MFIQGDEPDQDGWFGVHSEAKSSREHDWSYRMKELEPGYVVEVQSQIRNPQTIVLADLSKLLRNNPSGMTVDAIEKYFFDVDTYLIRNILKTLERQNLARREKEAVSPGMRGGRKKDLWFWSGPGVNGHGTTS
jgi:predicted transcriptional regulator